MATETRQYWRIRYHASAGPDSLEQTPPLDTEADARAALELARARYAGNSIMTGTFSAERVTITRATTQEPW